MKFEIWTIKEYGIRYWLAYVIVRLAYRIKDTIRYQVIRTPAGSSAVIMYDAWGVGVVSTKRMAWEFEDIAPTDWPVIRDFDDFDAALEWAHRENVDG